MDMEWESDDELEKDDTLMHHIVLPRVLPNKISNYCIESGLMHEMVDNVKSLAEFIPAKTIDLFLKLQTFYDKCAPEDISMAINNLGPGETFPIFMQGQGYGITIHVPPNERVNDVKNVIVATFPGNLDPSEIYRHDGDIELNYPERAIKVKFSRMIRSEYFANQLCVLDERSKYKKPDCGPKWLLTLLMDDVSVAATQEEYPVITKKVRDEVLGNEMGIEIFRRSGLYMSVKAMLQHSLTQQMGALVGKFLYKIIMLKFMAVSCAPYAVDRFDIDLVSQMIAKMARRIEKLGNMRELEELSHMLIDYDKINTLYNEVIKETHRTIKETRMKIDERVKKRHINDEKNAKIPILNGLNFERDIVYRMENLREYLAKRESNVEAMNTGPSYSNDGQHSNDSFLQSGSSYYFDSKRLPSFEITKISENKSDQRIFWMNFERHVLYEMEMGMGTDRWQTSELCDCSNLYAEFAESMYKDNPLFVSRMLLVRLKLIAMLDQRATEEHPLLCKYQTGINADIINCLVLPQRADMLIAFKIEKYFRDRNRATYPSLIEKIDNFSFAVEFARNNPIMKEIRDDILAKDKENAEMKTKELEREREKANILRTEANALVCEDSRKTAERNHARYCRRCDLQNKANKITIQSYERLLPENEIEQYAIVFELKIPNEIACLRDVLCKFVEYCSQKGQRKRIKTKWNDILKEFDQPKTTYVKLGSTKPSKTVFILVAGNINDLIVQNAHDCMYYYQDQLMSSVISIPKIKLVCTFQAQDEYADLQLFINSTEHTENQVLASQSNCKSNLTLSEYKSFGLLRCDGHRLQLRRLYAMLATEALSFEKESVLALIMQTLWEAGVSGDRDSIRESHMDFADEKFCNKMIELLTQFVDQQKNNWSHPFKLLVAALIAIRAFEINDSAVLASDIAKLLSQIRSIASDWIDKIGELIHNMTNRDENTERELRKKLIYVSIIGGVTFFVNPKHEHFYKIFRIGNDDNECTLWLRFIINLKNNVRMYTNDEEQLPVNLRMFLQLMTYVGLSLEEKIKELIITQNQVPDLIRKQWPRAEFYSTFKDIHFQKDHPNILAATVNIDWTESSDQTVTIDIITGTFLVDGMPLSILPSDITNSDIYKWFFGNTVFEVQPDAPGSFSTTQKYNNCSYEFKMISDQIIITERKFDVFELIHPHVFIDDFPHNLVNEYSHWWNRQEKYIEFRLRLPNKVHFSKQITVDYRLDLIKYHLIHVQTQRLLLDVKSVSFAKITQQLSRLEHFKYIQVMYLADDQKAIAELYRMNLKFTIRCFTRTKNMDLESNEFVGMRVNRTQKIGTLYGLQHGLLLKSHDNVRQILLIPNAHISTTSRGIFATVTIETKRQLQNPPFYQYKVDKISSQLKSSNGSHASWFFLAYLHAITSHGEIEPLTGMTGTERALQILQSAFAWSSSPYEPEAIKILTKISHLTPLRRLVNNVQHISWPKYISSRSAQDCFVFITQKLLADSQRLRSLHDECSEKEINQDLKKRSKDQSTDLNSKLKLNERDHRRCQPFNPNLSVSDAFIKHKIMTTSPLNSASFSFCDDTRTVCILYHKQRFRVPVLQPLKRFLIGDTSKTLNGFGNRDRLPDLFYLCDYEGLRDMWLALYDAALRGTFSSEQFIILLSYYAHRGENIQPILALQTVVMNRIQFQDIYTPQYKSYELSAGNFIHEDGSLETKAINTIINIFKQHFKPPSQYNSQEWLHNGCKKKYDDIINWLANGITEQIGQHWPCSSIIIPSTWPCIDFGAVNDAINERLRTWCANYELNVFIKNVENKLNSLKIYSAAPFEVPLCAPIMHEPKNWQQMTIDFDKKICKNAKKFQQEIAEARNVWEMKANDTKNKSTDWWEIYNKICHSDEMSHLTQTGLCPRTVASLVLPKIVDPQFNYDLKCLIGAYAMAIAREQYQLRNRDIDQNSTRQELQPAYYENWTPNEYPEWLLFQIEQNLWIRRIQIEIAKRMIEPPGINGVKHSVMQLNMAEGKTSVIVPILAAKLADGTQACQIIVLKSLFATNLKSLRQQLGGYLNRRIYVFPCRRDMPIEGYASEILNIYEECKREKGVILALPEHRLSFQLKIYESISMQLKTEDDTRNFNTAKTLLDIHKWTNQNIRTILDESDAILHAKYQLIYTVGKQMQPDGESQRWLVAQAVLKRVSRHMQRLYERFGAEKVEFGRTYGVNAGENSRTDIFTPCRILDESVFDALKDGLINDFLEGRLDLDFPAIDEAKKASIADLLRNKVLDRIAFRSIEHLSVEKQNIIYILSGFLRFEILKLALTKRWRVHYGVDVKGKRKMAIPFKAKDVAAEMTEFGHPDVAICFTQMSYYYSGLTDDQLYKVFSILETMPDAVHIFEKWIVNIPINLQIQSIVSYKGVNLDDSDQRNHLFSRLRYNMHVIDFWLSNVVFPHELKIFEKKLMCTAWDLCSDHFKHRVTGFSGTNDTKNILPISIAQNDLKELENTNKNMRNILVHEKNSVYQRPGNLSGKQILRKLVDEKIQVLLDSGALMLELNNKQVAEEWLQLTPDYNAAVYFDESDTLQTIDRNNIVVEFDYSVYREDLSKCVVYLDDAHTRGTDLKFPTHWRACVTLSGDITRDKTVQSCMRMRQLATTQSILFWPSYEADIRLRELSRQGKVESKHVMEFVENNSKEFETANTVHWSTGALNYVNKLVGHKLYENAVDDSTLVKLFEACVEDDYVKLNEMYEKEEVALTRIVSKKFNKLADDLEDILKTDQMEIYNFVLDMRKKCFLKLNSMGAKNIKRFTHALDEEQEKELEQEAEEQRQVERPPNARPANPKFVKDLKTLVRDGVTGNLFNTLKNSKILLPIAECLASTQMAEYCENNEDAWASHLFVTKDFATVVDYKSQTGYDFLRPVFWIARISNPDAHDILVLMSSFECNELIPAFRKSVNSTLFMYRPRLSNLHSNLIDVAGLQVTKMTTINPIDIEDKVQIGVYAGLMYFCNEDEQNAYCAFLGLHPRPWTREQQDAFNNGIIDDNCFIPILKRKYPEAIALGAGKCKFQKNPTDLGIKLIKAHHGLLPKNSHAASILIQGIKARFMDEVMEID